MGVRRPALDHDAAELARRRLSLLGAELTSVVASPGSSHSGELAEQPVTRETSAPQHDVPQVAVRVRTGRHAHARMPWTGRLAGRAVDALPPTLHGRLGVSAHHVTVVALLLATVMTAATWMLVRAEPEALPRHASLRLPAAPVADTSAPAPVGVPPPVPSAPAVPVAGMAGPTALPTGQVVVHVAGRVRHPGVVELPAGSRVIDAIEAAGGARPGAHLGLLNLARVLVDGEQVAVGVPGAAAAQAPTGGTTAALVPGAPETSAPLVNLNTASQAELEELPGVGPVTATSIIDWRTENGGFSTVDELVEVSGIGEVTLAELRDLVTV
jgi:competence protein ComEA